MTSGQLASEWITAGTLVQDALARHPEIASIFVRHGLRCAGCYISPFHTIADTAREYEMAVEPLLNDLNRALVVDLARDEL